MPFTERLLPKIWLLEEEWRRVAVEEEPVVERVLEESVLLEEESR